MLAWILIFCACVTLSDACSCVHMPGVQRFCRYDLIVRGTAVAEYEEREEPYDRRDPLSRNSPYSDFVYTIRVKHAIKVPDFLKGSSMIRIRTPVQSSMCGTRLRLDVDGVFFGYVNHKGEIQTGICDPNVMWEALSPQDKKLITQDLVPLCAQNPGTIGPPGIKQ